MRNRTILFGVVALSAIYLVSSMPQGQTADNLRVRQQWEYKVGANAADLNKLGEDGWELVATTASQNAYQYYFKRPKQ
jgi:hypothetical protein